MKKILLLAAAALMVTTASAQLQRSSSLHSKVLPKADMVVKPEAQKKEMHQANNVRTMLNAPKKASYVDGFYKRPAGGFTGFQYIENEAWGGGYYAPFLFLKPYAPYTYESVTEGTDDECYIVWDYQLFVYDPSTGWQQQIITEVDLDNLTVQYDWEYDEVPLMYIGKGVENPEALLMYQMGGYEMSGTDAAPVATNFHPSEVLAYPTFARAFGEEEGSMDMLVSSKTFCYGGRHGDQRYLMSYYSGCEPFGNNEDGFWFGKNAGRSNGMPVNGIAQAFEKPSYPYLLKQVVLETTGLVCDAPVEMTCKVYRLADGIPAYNDSNSVALPEEPGELIAMGRATVTPETNEANDGFIIFTLYGEEDGIEFEITPTIDDAILVAVDGYNDEGMEHLVDFSALISSDTESDEGYGELAYIKYGLSNEDGEFSGDYVWAGLNNFFSTGSGGMKMMTGLTIFITQDTPFMTFNYSTEDGEFTFPDEGGLMVKPMGYNEDGELVSTESIEFFAWCPSVDEGWTLSCDGDEVPEWLNIELTDGEEDGQFNYAVNATVEAEPLPEGVAYREAVVRFEFPGAFLDYKFMQGTKPEPPVGNKYDINGDGEVNIADVNALIDIILTGNNPAGVGDLNDDREINIADINALIDYILNK